jgi:hypothetical protein
MLATTDSRPSSPAADQAPDGLRPDPDEAAGRTRGAADANNDDRPTSFLDALRRMLASVHS